MAILCITEVAKANYNEVQLKAKYFAAMIEKLQQQPKFSAVQPIVLPSTFAGSPRWHRKKYLKYLPK